MARSLIEADTHRHFVTESELILVELEWLLRSSVESSKYSCLISTNNVFHISLNIVSWCFVPHLVFVSDHHYVLTELVESFSLSVCTHWAEYNVYIPPKKGLHTLCGFEIPRFLFSSPKCAMWNANFYY